MAQSANAISVVIAATATSQNVQLPASSLNGIEVYNTGTIPVFVQTGATNAVVATTTTSRVVMPGNLPRIFQKGNENDQFVACIGSGAGPTNVYFVPCSSDEKV